LCDAERGDRVARPRGARRGVSAGDDGAPAGGGRGGARSGRARRGDGARRAAGGLAAPLGLAQLPTFILHRTRRPATCCGGWTSGTGRGQNYTPAFHAGAPRNPMKIASPVDSKAMVDHLPSFSLYRHQNVTRLRTPAKVLDELVARLKDADVVVSIRERVE